MMTIEFDTTKFEEGFVRLYESGKLTYEQFDEQSKRLLEVTKEMKMKEEETKQKQEETKLKEEETKQILLQNNCKNAENISKAVSKLGETLRPILANAISLIKSGVAPQSDK